MIHLVTYHTPDMSISAQRCKEAALKHGVDKVWTWTRAALEQTEFFEQNREILDTPRGSGLWAWKPFIILETMAKTKPDDIIIYMDAGVELINTPDYIIDRMDNIWLFGNMYDHRAWCKKDAMDAMQVWPEGKQCQASVIFVRNKVGAAMFITKWLEWCFKPGMIDDSPSVASNYPEYSEHRHDQALLTNLAYIHKIRLHWWPAVYNNGAFTYTKEGYTDNYPPLFHHTRKRDSEW